MKTIYTKSIRETIGRNLTKHLEARPDVKVQELAERAGIERQYIYAIKKGNANVTVDKVEAIARALKIPVDSLVCEQQRNGKKRSA